MTDQQDKPKGTPVPARGSSRKGGRPAGRPAAGPGRPGAGSNRARAAQAAAERRRRNFLLGGGAIAVVVIVVVVLVVVKVSGGGSKLGSSSKAETGTNQALPNAAAPRQPLAPAAATHLTTIPLATLTSAQASGLSNPKAINDPPLTSGGKPDMVYIGAEFCPICATERWVMVEALSQFGTFTNLQQTHSAVSDGNIPTLSFYGSTYSSPYLTFSPTETTTNQPSGNYYVSLETPSPANAALWAAKEGKQEAFPFIDIGGKYLLETSQFDAATLENKSFPEILADAGDNSTSIGADIDASAAILTKDICAATGQKPAATCQAVAQVKN